ncbi:MAG: hypothetical protein KBT12_03235, partial [Bacteroidales bacterium]|nr:hypothetical protein [Candidatus Physcousia equi]
MKIELSIDYRTNWGEVVTAEFDIRRAKGANLKRSFLLETQDGVLWSGEVNLNVKDAIGFTYYYNIKKNDIVVRQGWMGAPRSFHYDEQKT